MSLMGKAYENLFKNQYGIEYISSEKLTEYVD